MRRQVRDAGGGFSRVDALQIEDVALEQVDLRLHAIAGIGHALLDEAGLRLHLAQSTQGPPASETERLTTVSFAAWLMLLESRLVTMAAAMASLRTPSLLALTEVWVVSLSAMRLTICWSVAFDQVPCQPEPRNCSSTLLVMNRPSVRR
jgi:hypothetical protein